MRFAVAVLAVGLFGDNYLPLRKGNVWTYAGPREGGETKAEVTADEDVKGTHIFTIDRLTAEVKLIGVTSDDKGVVIRRRNSKDLAEPLPLLKLPAKKGDTWKGKWEVGSGQEDVTFEVMGEEKVKVPAGEYTTVRVRMTIQSADRYFEDHWWAKDVGLVKSESMERGKRDSLYEMKSFTPAK